MVEILDRHLEDNNKELLVSLEEDDIEELKTEQSIDECD